MRLACIAFLFLPACGTIRSIQDSVEKLQAVANQAELRTDQVQRGLDGLSAAAAQMGDRGREIAAKIEEARGVVARADKNQDGKVSGWSEWYALLAGLVGILVAWVRSGGALRAVGQTDEKRSATAKELHAKIEDVARAVAAISGHASPGRVVPSAATAPSSTPMPWTPTK